MSETSSLNNYSFGDNELSLSFSVEYDRPEQINDSDEMPAFQIRLLSPMGRTPSPIENIEEHDTPRTMSMLQNAHASTDLVSLSDINAQISPPRQGHRNLETIYEDVFLNTPPRTECLLATKQLDDALNFTSTRDNEKTSPTYKDKLFRRLGPLLPGAFSNNVL